MSKTEQFLRYLGNELTTEEKAEFENWLKNKPEYLKELEELKEVWNKTKNYPYRFKPNTSKAKKEVHKLLGLNRQYKKQSLLTTNWYKIAAAVILVISILSVSRFLYLKADIKEEVVFITGTGIKEIVLPDSTHVWLNKNSTLKYPAKFTQGKREIHLSGEAYFEVYENPQAPFSVQLKKSQVTVLGTHFNIMSYPGKLNTKVTVSEGKVRFGRLNNRNQSVILVKNQSATLNNISLKFKKEQNEDLNYLAWKTNILKFSNTPLNDALGVLSKHFNVNYKFQNSKYKKLKVSGRFSNKRLNEIVNSLSIATSANIKIENDTIFVK